MKNEDRTKKETQCKKPRDDKTQKMMQKREMAQGELRVLAETRGPRVENQRKTERSRERTRGELRLPEIRDD